MSDQDKTKDQLLTELAALRQQVADLEALEAKRQRTEEALRQERDLVARIMETSPLGVVVVNKEGQITFANRYAEQKLGLTKDELAQRTYNAPQWRISAYNGSPFPDEYLPFPRVMASRKPVFDVRHAIELVDGRRVLLSINAAPLFDESGQASGMVASIEDITERIQAEEALSRSEATLRSIFRAAPIGIGLVSNRVLLWTNDTLQKMLGYSAEELEGKSARIFYESDEEFERVGREKYAEIAEKGTGTIETRFQHKDGRFLSLLLSSTPLNPSDLSAGVVFTALDISERERAKEAIREERDRAQRYLDVAGVMLVALNERGEITLMNRVGHAILGYEEGELLGRSWFDTCLPAHIREQVATVFRALMSGETEPVESFENPVLTKTGQERIIAWRNTVLTDDLGRIVGTLSSGEDITERRRIQQALRESEAKYRNIVESIPMGMHMYELMPDGRLIFVGANPAADAILGVENRQFVGQTIEEAFPALTETEVPEKYRLAASEGGTWSTDQILYEEGQIAGAYEVHAFQTAPGRMTAAFLDVTDRQRSGEALARRAAQLALINQIGGQIAAVLDLDGLLNTAARLIQESFGYHHVAVFTLDRNRDRVVMRARAGFYTDLFPPDYRLAIGKGIVGWVAIHGQRLLANDVESEPRYVNAYPDRIPTRSEFSAPIQLGGETVGVLDVQSPLLGAFDDNDILVIETLADQIAVAMDNARLYEAVRQELAERMRAEEALHRRTQQLEALRQVGLEIAAQLDIGTLLRSIVARAVELGGGSAGGLYLHRPERDVLEWAVAIGPSSVFIGSTLRRGQGLSGKVWEAGQPVIVDNYRQWEGRASVSGDYTFTAIVGVPVRWGDEFLGVLNILADTPGAFSETDTDLLSLFAAQAAIAIVNARLFEGLQRRMKELRSAQAQLIQSAKMAAIGGLAAGVAHELNNPLTSVLGFAELAMASMSPDDPIRHDLATVVAEARRARDVVRNLLAFSRQSESFFERWDVNQVIRETLALIRQQIEKSGVVLNERYATDLPSLMLANTRMKQVFLNLFTNALHAMPEGGTLTILSELEGDEVAIRIADTGVGIPPEDLPYVFEPFFTTKPAQQGTGLGLSISLSIVREHGGRLEAESRVGEGSIFTVWLPVEAATKEGGYGG